MSTSAPSAPAAPGVRGRLRHVLRGLDQADRRSLVGMGVVIVVLLFTHPTLQLLARTRFFSSGHPMSGLDPEALGAVYRGAANFRAPTVPVAAGTAARSSKEAARRQTIAERKAAMADATAKED